jgi:predicted Zn-ribbon and HTH transcriptional regulator
LRPFVAQAVRGWATAKLPFASAYSVSMMADLTRFQGLEIGYALTRRCAECGDEHLGAPARCPQCDAPAREDRDWHTKKSHQYVLSTEWDGWNVLQHRWRCKDCGNLFLDDFTDCPICQGKRSKRPTAVWDGIHESPAADIDDPQTEVQIYRQSFPGGDAHTSWSSELWVSAETAGLSRAAALEQLDKDDPALRLQALDAIMDAQLADPRLIRAMAGLLGDPDRLVREQALAALQDSDPGMVFAALQDLEAAGVRLPAEVREQVVAARS